MSDQPCRWESKYHADYKCDQPALPDDPEDYCILHLEDDNKDPSKFEQAFSTRVSRTHRRVLIGCYFPKSFNTISRFFEHVPVEGLDCSEATFTREMYFGKATFRQRVSFRGTTFLENVDFDEAIFSDGADFSLAEFSHEAKFTKTSFKEGSKLDFRKAKFKGDVKFLNTWVGAEEVSFSHTEFIEDGEVVFDNPHFRTRAYFIETIFGKSCTFRHAEFPRADRLAVFQNTDLSNCNFLHSNIDKVDFRYCTFNDKPGKLNVLKDERDADEEVQKHPSEETLRWKMYEPVRRLYLELKRNFEDKKDWDTAGDFHYGEMECRRKMKGWFGRNLFSIEAIYFWLSGYGERPQRAAVSLGLLIGFCAIFYMYFEVLGSDFEGGYVKGFMKSGCNSLKITTLQRIGSVDEPHSLPAKVVFMFESIMGPILIALLALALRRKVKR